MEYVFVIHNGKQDYVKSCLNSAKKNKNITIYIGDNYEIERYADEFFLESEITSNFGDFVNSYKHMSTNSELFELGCFKRFFLMYEIAKKKEINHFWMIDSDVLLLINLTKFTQETLLNQGYKASLSTQFETNEYGLSSSPHISFWTLEALDHFIKYCL